MEESIFSLRCRNCIEPAQSLGQERFLSEMISLVPFMFVCTYIYSAAKAVPTAFGLSFAVTIFVFTIALIVLEWKERKGAENDY